MIQSVRISFFLGLILLLNSCFGPIKELKYQIEDSWDESISNENNPEQLKNIDNLLDIKITFSGSFDSPSKTNLFMVSHGNIVSYVSSLGQVTSIDFLTQSKIWSYEHSQEIVSGLARFLDNIFFVDYSGYLVCLSSDGNLNWKSFVGEIFSPPLAIEESVIVKTTDNKIISLNSNDGSIKWIYKVPSSPLPIRASGELVYSDQIIYSGISSGKVLAINSLNGSLVWETTYSSPKGSSEIERSNDTTSSPIVGEYSIYVVSSNGNIAALSKLDGKVLWSRPLSSFIGMINLGDHLIVTHNSGALYSISKESSKVAWRNSDLLGRDVSKAFIFKDYIVVTDYQGFIHFIDSKSGEIVARVSLGGDPLLYPEKLSDDNIIVANIFGEYYILNLHNHIYDKNLPNSKTKISIDYESKDIGKNENVNKENSDSFIDSLNFWD